MAEAAVRVACVGDSITWGYGVANRNTQAYPALLQKRLGKGYQVKNFGRGGATALKHLARPPAWMVSYWQTPEFKQATKFKANIVILMLGTNDSNPVNRLAVRKHFIADFTALVRHFQKLSTHPKVFVCLPPSLEDGSVKGPYPPLPRHGIIAKITTVIKKTHATEINVFRAVAGQWKLFIGDHIHLNAQGHAIMARVIYRVLVKARAVKPPAR